MSELFYTIHPAVFEKFPGYVRGVVVAHDVTNGASPAELLALLRAEEAALRTRLTLEHILEHPRIQAWRDVYRAIGIRPAEYRPSPEALARRVLRGDALPAINTLVDIGNLISLRHLVPAGGHAIDKLTQDIALRPAAGSEDFVALGSDVLEHPEAGEFIFVEGSVVLTRRWVWRQSQHTLTLPDTRAIEFNIDALPVVPAAEVKEICAAVIELVQRFCGGHARAEILSADNPRIRLGA